jgi:nucleotide-binding universal stress UspA family protein
MYTNILFATDLLNEHNHLTQKASVIAKQFKAKLYFLHVIELPASIQLAQGLGFTELANPAKDDAQTVLSLISESLNVPIEQQFVEIGSVKEHIFNKAQELNCQLIIIGSHASTGLHSFLGSTANAIINHAPCDILTLRI